VLYLNEKPTFCSFLLGSISCLLLTNTVINGYTYDNVWVLVKASCSWVCHLC